MHWLTLMSQSRRRETTLSTWGSSPAVDLVNTDDPVADRGRQAKAIIAANATQLRQYADHAKRTSRSVSSEENARIARHIEGRFREMANHIERVYLVLDTLINLKKVEEEKRQKADVERTTYRAKFRFTTPTGKELALRYHDMWPFGSPYEYWYKEETRVYRLMRSDNNHRSDNGTITPLIPWLKKNITHALYLTVSSDSDSESETDIKYVRYYGTLNAHIIREDGEPSSVFQM